MNNPIARLGGSVMSWVGERDKDLLELTSRVAPDSVMTHGAGSVSANHRQAWPARVAYPAGNSIAHTGEAGIGLATVGIGMFNATLFAQGLLYAIPSPTSGGFPSQAMLTMGLWLTIAVALGMAAVVVAQKLARKRFAAYRQPIPLDVLIKQADASLSAHAVIEVWTEIGAAYGIDPQLIRPADTLKAFSAMDSWDLGKGDDRLNGWLRSKSLTGTPQIATVKDLALWVQSCRRPSTSN